MALRLAYHLSCGWSWVSTPVRVIPLTKDHHRNGTNYHMLSMQALG